MKNVNIRTISDRELFNLCQQYGREALMWRRKFIGLLPEVHRRKLYEKKGFTSIFEFAKKLAGLSEEQTRTALNLDRIFEDKPTLKKIFLNGEVSINKLVRITSVVTKENEELWANQVRILSQKALETLIRDAHTLEEIEDGGGFKKRLFDDTELRAQLVKPHKIHDDKSEFFLSPEIQQQLLELHQKGIDINELLQAFLDERKQKIEQEKEEIAQERSENSVQPSRYIPTKIQKLIQKEHGTKCSIHTCKKPSEELHHSQRFALAQIHDPRYLAPVCKEHHLIAHSIDLRFQDKRRTGFNTF